MQLTTLALYPTRVDDIGRICPRLKQSTKAMPATHWYIYILRCSDNTLYTGVTTDCERRLQEHNHSPRGARYTKGRRPVTLVYLELSANRTQAQQREAQIKRLTAPQKERLIASMASTVNPGGLT